MPRSGYVAEVRQRLGSRLLLVPSVTLAITDDRGGILLVRHDDGGLWAPPGGTIELGETPADAAAREAWEELHLQVEPTELVGVYGGPVFEVEYDNGDRTSYVMTVFGCEVLAGTPTPDALEIHEARFVGPDDWQELHVPVWVQLVLPELFDWARAASPSPARFAPATWKPA